MNLKLIDATTLKLQSTENDLKCVWMNYMLKKKKLSANVVPGLFAKKGVEGYGEDTIKSYLYVYKSNKNIPQDFFEQFCKCLGVTEADYEEWKAVQYMLPIWKMENDSLDSSMENYYKERSLLAKDARKNKVDKESKLYDEVSQYLEKQEQWIEQREEEERQRTEEAFKEKFYILSSEESQRWVKGIKEWQKLKIREDEFLFILVYNYMNEEGRKFLRLWIQNEERHSEDILAKINEGIPEIKALMEYSKEVTDVNITKEELWQQLVKETRKMAEIDIEHFIYYMEYYASMTAMDFAMLSSYRTLYQKGFDLSMIWRIIEVMNMTGHFSENNQDIQCCISGAVMSLEHL